jgi:hypothetical protein
MCGLIRPPELRCEGARREKPSKGHVRARIAADRVPTTVVDGKKRLVGPVAEAVFVEAIAGG